MSGYYNEYWRKKKYKQCDDFLYKWPCLKKYFPLEPRIKILDFGCGVGQLVNKKNEINPTSTYIGVDVSEDQIKINKKKFPKEKFYAIQDGGRLPFRNRSIDFIISADSIEHVYDTQMAFQEFARVLKPGGKIVITTPYHGILKNLAIVLTNNFELIFDPLDAHIRFYTKTSMDRCLNMYKLKPIKYDYFGRFYPFSRGMLVIAEKSNIRSATKR